MLCKTLQTRLHMCTLHKRVLAPSNIKQQHVLFNLTGHKKGLYTANYRGGNSSNQETERVIAFYQKFPGQRLRLQELVNFSGEPKPEELIRAAQFLHEELPTRWSHQIQVLEALPQGLCDMPSIRQIRTWYAQSIMDIHKSARPIDTETENKFYHTISGIRKRHDPVVVSVAKGLIELKKTKALTELHLNSQIHEWLDKFFMSRIGTRTLVNHHVSLHEPPHPPGWIGVFQLACSPAEIAQDAILNARELCLYNYGVAPKVGLYGANKDVTLTYIPNHLHHIIFELLKNSMRAVVEFHGADKDIEKPLPEIRLIISGGEEDITIKISDEGGGIARSGISHLWTYLYTTAQVPTETLLENDGMTDFSAPLAGLGYGLPLSRLYARYFGGDLQVISSEGYGTDAYVHLSRLEHIKETAHIINVTNLG